MVKAREIIGTPFKTTSPRTLKETNTSIKKLVADARRTKGRAMIRQTDPKFKFTPLPKSARPGRIE